MENRKRRRWFPGAGVFPLLSAWSLPAAIDAAAAGTDIAVTPAIVTKKRDFLETAASTIERLAHDIAIVEVAPIEEIVAVTHIEPAKRVISTVIVEDVVMGTKVPVPAARAMTVAIVTPGIAVWMAITTARPAMTTIIPAMVAAVFRPAPI
ncbi:MAG: hypothetical protein HKN14_05405 [Marinicaulis sp.]|nr:hypothetical protein [Marinicaulis sp.]NNL88223.1 hypothetical protein [Marinicaulis sp.]